MDNDEFYNTPIRPVSEEEWPYECIPRSLDWVIGQPNPRKLIKEWCEQRKLEDPEFEWFQTGVKKYPIRPAPKIPGQVPISIERTLVGSFYYFKRANDAMLFKLSWS